MKGQLEEKKKKNNNNFNQAYDVILSFPVD